MEDQVANRSTAITKNVNLNSHLYCPHDLSTGVEFRDDLPTLLGNDNLQNDVDVADASLKLIASSPALSVFEYHKTEVITFGIITLNF